VPSVSVIPELSHGRRSCTAGLSASSTIQAWMLSSPTSTPGVSYGLC
jgi:hypothetical protein